MTDLQPVSVKVKDYNNVSSLDKSSLDFSVFVMCELQAQLKTEQKQ